MIGFLFFLIFVLIVLQYDYFDRCYKIFFLKLIFQKIYFYTGLFTFRLIMTDIRKFYFNILTVVNLKQKSLDLDTFRYKVDFLRFHSISTRYDSPKFLSK